MSLTLKKILFIVLINLIFCSCSYVSKNSNKIDQNRKPDLNQINTAINPSFNIVSSFYPIYIATKNVVKDISNVSVSNMVKPQTGCLHDYQLTPENLIKLKNSKAFVINGINMESFLDKIIAQQPQIKVIDSSLGINPIKNKSNNEINPHIWLSIPNMISQVQNIETQLAKLDPSNKNKYEKNSNLYIKKLSALNDEYHKALNNIPNKRIITFHECFSYLALEYGLDIIATMSTEPGETPSAGKVADVIELSQYNDIKAIFAEPHYLTKEVETVACESGLKVYTLDCAVLGPDSYDAYLNIMGNNLITLKEALK